MRLGWWSLTLALAAASLCSASPVWLPGGEQLPLGVQDIPRPLVIWSAMRSDDVRHGLGDTALSKGIQGFIDDIGSTYPGIFVYSVQVPEGGSEDDERKAGFYGNAEEQGQAGCDQLAGIPELQGGFDAMGFSQGGLFLRWYAQYCPGPKIHNLITFGTPHYGIAALIPCPTPPTLTCLLAARAARAGIYTPWAQTHLVQAAYYRDPARLDEFLDANTFLRDLNAEGVDAAASAGGGDERDGSAAAGDDEALGKKKAGGRGLGHLANFVAVMFDADRTVSPAQSAHFATYSPENKTLVIPLPEQPLWTQDRIGLRALDASGGLYLEHCPGEHMDLDSGDCAKRIVERWVGH